MPCKPYNAWLRDAALGAIPPRKQARLECHLAACSACRGALERERLLLAAIGCGVAASVALEPTPDMVARVRIRVAEENASAGGSLPLWLPIAGVALAVFALLALWPRPQVSSTPQIATEIPSLPAPPGEVLPAPEQSVHHAVRQPRQAAPQEPQVLVPPGQWQAVLELADAVNRGRLNGLALAAGPEGSGKPLALEAMSLIPLEIPRLDDGRKITEDNDLR